jgi:hypothetical protein
MSWTKFPAHHEPGSEGSFLALLAAASDHDSLCSWPRPPAGPRDRRDFDLGRMTGPTAQLRAKFHSGYTLPDLQFLLDLGQLAQTCPFQLSELLEEYGPVMYEQSASRRNFAEIFNAVQQRFPFLKGVMNWPLEARNHMGECLPQFSSPSNSFSTDERLFAWLGSGTGLP